MLEICSSFEITSKIQLGPVATGIHNRPIRIENTSCAIISLAGTIGSGYNKNFMVGTFSSAVYRKIQTPG